jgi:hypothetical protein
VSRLFYPSAAGRGARERCRHAQTKLPRQRPS